jgi:putative endonuclease
LPREPCVYILANRRQGTLYTGVTSNLAERIFQHREGLTPGFSSRYGCNRLVFYERYERMDEAIAREKQIKGGSRARKIALIEAMNPGWRDLYTSLAEDREWIASPPARNDVSSLPKDRGCPSRHCEERSDEAIHPATSPKGENVGHGNTAATP